MVVASLTLRGQSYYSKFVTYMPKEEEQRQSLDPSHSLVSIIPN